MSKRLFEMSRAYGWVLAGLFWWACDDAADRFVEPDRAGDVEQASGALTLRSELEAARTPCELCWDDYTACELACEAAHPNGGRTLDACRETCRIDHGACIDLADCDEPGEGEACRVVTSVADIEVPEVRIAGTFTVNGGAPLWLAEHTGRLELRSATLGRVALGRLHEGSYQQLLIPGTYDLVYRHLAGTLAPANAETTLATGLVVDGPRVLDVDVPAAIVSGTITMGGAAPPASQYERGELRLRDRATGASFKVGVSSAGSYAALVIPGTYDVVYKRLLSNTIAPKNGEAILGEVTVVGNTAFDIDIPVVARTGTFKLNGANPPNSIYENAQVSLRDTVTGDVIALGQTRDGTFSVKLVPGTYDVLYSRLTGGTIVPSNSFAVIATKVPLLAPGDGVIDIPVVSIAGAFTLDGAAFPNSIYANARIWLAGPGDDRVLLGQTRHQSYTAKVIPGTYDIAYEVLITTGVVPANTWALVDLARPIAPAKVVRTVDVDVATGWLEAEVSYWGGAPFASIYENGLISATSGDEDRFDPVRTRDVGDTVKVVAGSYALRYSHLIGNLMPINGDAQVASADLAPGATAELAVDLRPGTLSGSYTHGGQPFPGSFLNHARIALSDIVTGDRIELPRTHQGGYTKRLLPGTYEVLYDHGHGASFPANKGARLDCITFVPLAP